MNYDHFRHYARGWLLHFFGRSEAAYAAFVEAYRHDPGDVQTVRHLAGIAASKQRWAVAEDWFEKALALQPNDADSWFNLGYVRERAGKSERAIAAFDESVRLKPSQDRAWYGMGLAYARLGEHAKAAAAFAEAARLQPMNGEAFYQWGMALHHANRPEEVAYVVEQLVAFDPKRAKKLVQDTARADLLRLIPDLPF